MFTFPWMWIIIWKCKIACSKASHSYTR
jgi:hypothetical protein